jgi:hypothetical protein
MISFNLITHLKALSPNGAKFGIIILIYEEGEI